MAGLKGIWLSFLFCLLSQCVPTLQGICASTVNSGISGREFVFAPMPNIDKTGSIGVVLQAVSDNDTYINIFVRGISLDENITLLSGSGPYDYPLPINSLIYENVAGKIDSTVVITSDNDIFVLAYNMRRSTSDVFSVIPKQHLGQEYFIATMTLENPRSGVISISASEQTTYLEIFLRSTVEFENDPFYAGDTIRYTLLPYETIQLLPQFINITGSRVLANASIAVSVGSKCANIPENVYACDHVAEQVAPFTAWGKAFIISPLAARTSGYVLQIVAGRNDTNVSYDNVIVKLNMSDYVTVDIQDQEMMAVSADKPISIMQYSTGATRDDMYNGDPSMMRVVPIEQYVTMATFPVYEYSSSFTVVNNNYLGVTSRCKYVEDINVWMDGVLVTPIWIENNTIEGSDGTMYCARWTAVYKGTYTLRSRCIVNETGHGISPTFSAVVYGTASAESYLYRAASDDRTLNCERDCEGDYSTDYPTSTLRTTTNEQDYTTRQTQTEEPSTGDYSTGYPTSTLQTTTNEQDYTTRQTQTEEPSTETDLICDSTSMTLIMDRSLLEIGDDARDVHFEDEECVGYNHDSQHVAITTSYDRCGTKQEQDENYMIFSNLVTYYNPRPANGTNQLITREHYLHIPVTCYLEREQVLGDSFIPQIGIYYGKEEGYGEFSLSLQRYTDSSFYRVANDSGKVVLGTPLYFGIGLTSVTNLTLLTESCWATSSPHPLDDQRYDIIANGCAVDSTTYIYNSYVPTFKGFRVDAFTFIGDYDQVYVHCSILICDNSDSSSRCAQGCLTRSRRSLQPTGSRSKPHTITDGPLSDASHFQQAMILDNGNDGDETSDPLMIAALSALCVLIALTAIMSLVIVRMRRQRPNLIGYRQVGGTEENY